MSIEVYNGKTLLYTLLRVMTASLTDRLSGERTLDFTVLGSRSQKIVPGQTVKLDGQIYSIVRVSRKISGGLPITAVSCEHISYLLNDEAYNLVTFVFEGTPLAGLQQLLSGTPFIIGTVEATTKVEVAFTEGTLNRRNALMRFIDACGCEVEYNGYAINLRKHRGSQSRKKLMDGENVSGIAVTLDGRENTASYEIALFKMVELQAGDEVNITYTPMGVNVNTRIVGITYNPFYRYTVRVEVGDYIPNLLASNATQADKIRQEFRAADGELRSTIQKVDGSMSELKQTVSGFDMRIQNAEGAVSSLRLTVNSFDTRIQNAEGDVSSMKQTVNGFDTRISTAEGDVSSLRQTVNSFSTQIKDVDGRVSTLSQNLTSITTRVSNAEGNITTVTQTANKINWIVASGTTSSNFTMTSRALSLMAASIDLSGYVTFSSLSTSGKTTINGANITTGKISADRIDTDSLRVRIIYAESGKVSLKEYTSNNMYIGGDGTWNYNYVNIFAGEQIKLSTWGGVGAHSLIIDTNNHVLHPATIVDWDLGTITYPFGKLWIEDITVRQLNSNQAHFGLNGGTFELVHTGSGVNTFGTSTYYWDTGYISKLFLSSQVYLGTSGSSLTINGTAIATGSDFAGSTVKMGGSTTYYIVANTSRQLCPSGISSTYPFYLGTSSAYWQYAYIGSTQIQIGNSTSSKIGFFGTTGIARQALSTTSNNMNYTSATASNYLYCLNNVIGILKKYGLIG